MLAKGIQRTAIGLRGTVARYRYLAAAAIAIGFVFVVANALVLTNYGFELDYLGVRNEKILSPSRMGAETERYLLVPLQQMLVRNGFSRFNTLSIYNEDLRTLYALPIFDFGILFKPTYWGYGFLSPAQGYSFSLASSIALLIGGFFLLFRRIGLGVVTASALSVAFYFSSFLQFWLHYFVTLVAFVPWIILAATFKHRIISALGVFYFSTAWLVSNLYPPLIVPLGLTIAVAIFILLPLDQLRRRFVLLCVACAAAFCVTYFYLHDAISAVQATSYPGDRVLRGGDDTHILMWWSQFIPTAFLHAGLSVLAAEAPEAAGAGSVLFLAIIVMSDYRFLMEPAQRILRRDLMLTSGLLLAMWTWILLPVPSWVGMPLFFHMVTPRRMVFGAGALMAIMAAIILARGRFKINAVRCSLLVLIVILSWLSIAYLKGTYDVSHGFSFLSLTVIPLAVLQAGWSLFTGQKDLKLIAVGAAGINLVAFGNFYGVQSAKPIFSPGNYAAKNSLETLSRATPNGVLAVAGERLNGAILGGLGFKSYAHAFLIPAPNALRPYFRDIPEEEFRFSLNRQSVLRLTSRTDLSATGLSVMVPVVAFDEPNIRSLVIRASGTPVEDLPVEGAYTVKADGNTVVIEGWARFNGVNKEQEIAIDTDVEITHAKLHYAAAPRRGVGALGGFVITLTLKGSLPVGSANGKSLTIFSTDPKWGRFKLEGPATFP